MWHWHTSVYRGCRTWTRLCKSGLKLAFVLGKGRWPACTNVDVIIWLGDLSKMYVLHLPHRGQQNCLVLWGEFLRLSMDSWGEKDVGDSSVVEWPVYLHVLRVSLMSPPSIRARDFNLNVLYCSWMFCPSVVHCFGVCFFHLYLLTYRFFWGRGWYFYFLSVVTTLTEKPSFKALFQLTFTYIKGHICRKDE